MAKYDIKDVKDILADEDYDIMVPEFLARAISKTARAGSTIHENQVETTELALSTRERLDKMKISPRDPLYKALSNSHGTPLEAQSRMVTATAMMAEAIGTVTKRLMP